jgi:hypothetical protein
LVAISGERDGAAIQQGKPKWSGHVIVKNSTNWESTVRKIREIACAGEQLTHAQEWLIEQSQDASEAMSREQIAIAREAKDAAWISARAAQGANTRATIAIMIAVISLIVSIVAPLYSK